MPHAQAFLGKIVRGPHEAERGGDPNSVIAHKSKTMESLRKVGTCGEHSFCDLYAPIACYTCRMFQPWLEADHRSVLDGLLDTRDERLREGSDPKWTKVNDRTIAAVKEVIAICDQTLAAEAA
ncbi:hypothetical protein GCM10011515_08460 [Tsuneonella deserti]|uniref:Uncharacterized protein n=1 Tax=Tsuneonella deserti TaxID=2035528 RepID=A0ABQ1S2I6_9SPHN|nr:hypothetical protein GCM10011515_08460 [Tsuneonella deserti]